ncbi:hypothetical protein [Tunturiibacter lichenicola]|uniref:hypothetical protein n=1 Tax=Tunturiibacter lichenicola TaxID=2051959 RepID=UPI003D9ACFE7
MTSFYMVNHSEIPPTIEPVEPDSGRLRASIWYSILFAAAQVGVLLICFAIAMKPWFLSHDGDTAFPSQFGYSAHAAGQNCDIVLYGDSTALTALDPAIIQANWPEDLQYL